MTVKNEQAYRTIGEVAESLDLPPHVLRFWETRFKELEPVKRAGGRRYYRPRDVELVKALRHLLYGQGYTIKGVQRILKEQGARAVIDSSRAGRFAAGFGGAPAEDAQIRASLDETETPHGGQPAGLGSVALESRESVEILRASPLSVEAEAPRTQLPALVARPLHDAAHLDDEDVNQLRLALADLAECRRLLRLTKS